MRLDLCNGTVSVRLSVRLSPLSPTAGRCGGFAAVGPAVQAISIGRRAPASSSECEQCHVVSGRRKLDAGWSVSTGWYVLQSRLRALSLCVGDTVKLRSKRRCTLGVVAADNQLGYDDNVRVSRVMRTNLRAKSGHTVRCVCVCVCLCVCVCFPRRATEPRARSAPQCCPDSISDITVSQNTVHIIYNSCIC